MADPTPAEAMITIRRILGMETSSHRATIAAVDLLHTALAPWREVVGLVAKGHVHPRDVPRRVHAAVLHLGQLLGAVRAGDAPHEDVVAMLRELIGEHKRLQDAVAELRAIRSWRDGLERELAAAGLPSSSVSPIVLATCLVHIAAPWETGGPGRRTLEALATALGVRDLEGRTDAELVTEIILRRARHRDHPREAHVTRCRARARAYLELFAGGAACALALMGGPGTIPPVGYMGGKRKLAAGILGCAGLRLGQGADRVLLVDAGEWGNVWSEVVRDGRALADRLLGWKGRDPSDLWRELAIAGRPEDPQERAAAYLWLQGRAASCTPVWWDAGGATTMARSASSGGGEQRVWQAGLAKPTRLVMADKPGRPAQRAQEMHPGPYGEAVERSREPKKKGRRSAGSGIMRHATVAHRIIKAQAALLSAAGVLVSRSHPPADEVAAWLGTPGDLQGVVLVLDPPYVGATRYEATCSRAEVVALAEDYRRLGALVLVCEAEALPELLAIGWHPINLRTVTGTQGKPEWLTCANGRQLTLHLERHQHDAP